MGRDERLEQASARYRRAIGLARAESTPTTWRRAVKAAKDLSREIAAAERARGKPDDAPMQGAPVVPLQSVGASRERDPWLFNPGADARATAPRCWRMERWPELTIEWERARALMDQARRLVDRAHAVCAEIRLEQARRPMP